MSEHMDNTLANTEAADAGMEAGFNHADFVGERKDIIRLQFRNDKRVLILMSFDNDIRVIAYTPGDPTRSEREYPNISDASLIRLMNLPV